MYIEGRGGNVKERFDRVGNDEEMKNKMKRSRKKWKLKKK